MRHFYSKRTHSIVREHILQRAGGGGETERRLDGLIKTKLGVGQRETPNVRVAKRSDFCRVSSDCCHNAS